MQKLSPRNIKNSVILHRGIVNLRSALTSGARFSTITNSPDAKVLYDQHSANTFEFKLNNPKVLNSIDVEMVDIICQKLKQWNADPSSAPRVAMISGTGEKAFCAGGDIVSIYNAHIGKPGFDKSIKADFFADEYLQDYELVNMKPMQISLWNGITMGGGVGVSCHAPIRVATEKTVYAMPETGIGFFTDVGGSYFLSRVKNNISLGLYLGLTGFRLKAEDLVQWGVATHYVTTDKLETLRQDLIHNVTASSSDDQILEIVNAHSDASAGQAPIENLDQINDIFRAEGSLHDVYNALLQSDTEFAKKTLKKLNFMSPLSCAIVFEQIKRGASMDLKSVFEMEYKLSQGFMDHTEFFEGVRALLVDKDKSPQWKHKTILDVGQDEVEWFFN